MEVYYSGTGQKVFVHEVEGCLGPCPVHRPSGHHMVDWPTYWREDRYMMERLCPHGVGHPDPDHIGYTGQESLHGCDGCCRER